MEGIDVSKRRRSKRDRDLEKRMKIAAIARNARAGAGCRYWLTIVSRTTCCAHCGGMLRKGREMVFRKQPQDAVCVACATREGISYRPSDRWERAHGAVSR